MAKLYFKIGADYDKVIRLRDEIKKLENQLKSFGTSTPNAEIKRTEERLASSRQEFTRLATEAAKAGAEMKDGLKKKIDSVTKSSDELSAEIIKQRAIIRETKEDVRMLSEQYSKMGKFDPKATSTLNQLNRAKAALNEQKYALGELQGQQASNRLELRQLTRQYREFSEETDKSTVTVDALMSSLKRTAAEIGGLAAIKKFGTDVIDATGKMQQLQVALSTILQSKSKADALLAEISEFAKKTPFNLDDVANGAKQLLAYGSSAENVVDELSMLGDVASGLQIPLGSLIYLYGTLRVQGRAYWRDIQQFQGRGVNVVEEMAKNLGVTQDQIKKLVEEGKIGFKDVEKAFQSMTSEGGKFNNMLENAAGTWPQRIANLEDTLFTKLVDFGNKYKEVFEFGIGTAEELVEHLDDVISVIGGLIAAYGTYRAALIATAVAQKAVGFVDSIRLIMAYRKEMGLATAAQQAFNLAAKSNIYVALLSVLVGLGTAVYMFTKRTNEATASQEALDEVSRNYNATVKSEQAEIDRLFDALRNAKEGTNEYQKAKDDILSKYGKYLNGLNSEISTLHDVEGAYKAVTAAARESARARAIESATSKAQEIYGESYTENASKLRNALIKQVGKTRSSAILAQLRKDLRDTGKVSEQVRKQIGDALTGDFSYGESKAWLTGLERNEKELKDAYKEIDDLFKETEKSTTEKSSNLLKDYNEAAKSYGNAQKRLDEINANRSKYTTKQYEDAVTKLKTAKSIFEKLGGETQTNKQRQSAAVKAENKRKKEADERKKAQEELNKSLLSLQQQNQDDEIALLQEGTQKRLAEIKNDYAKRIAEIDKQEAEFKKKNEEAGVTGLTGGLTKKQQTALQEARDNAAKEQRQQVQEAIKEENDARVTALQNYLKEYGDYEQKRLAINEEYNKKIADAASQVEKTSLQAELEKTLSELDFNEFKDKFNWEDIFGNLGDLTLKQLEDTRAQLRTLLADGNLDIDEYKTAVEQIGKVNEAIISEQDKLKDTFGLILPMAEERRKLELDVAEANARQNELLAEQQELLNGIETKRQDITTALQNAGLDINASDVNIGNQDAILSQLEGIFGSDSDIYKNVSKSFDELNKSERDLNNTTQKLDKAQADATSAQSKLNKFISDFGNKLQAVNEIMSLVSSNMQSLPDLFSQLGVDMDSAFGKGITDLANASQSATSAMQDAMSGNFVGALSNGIGAVKGVLSGFNNILGLGIGQGNAKETMERIDRLTESNDYLRTSIDRLTEKMDEAAGGRAIDYYEEALKAQERMNENYQDILDSSMRYTGAHHSNAYYWNLDGNSLRQVNALLGTSLTNSWDGFSKLTAEQMDEIRTHLPDIWEEMINQGKYGGDRFRDAWEDYADQAGKVEELTEQINENLTQTSFDSLRSNFLDTLMDMDADAQDFADDFNEMMQRALLNFAMGDMLDDQLKEWYDRLAETISNNNGELSQGDIESLRDEWQGMADEWLDMRDTFSEITGYKGSSSSTQQSASSKGYETMSQDTGDAINGRMTAIYEAELNIANTTTEQLAVLKAIYGQMGGNIADVASESKQILSTSYIQQNNISFPTAQLDALVDKVDKLDAKVADLVSFGADNRLSMQTLEENTTLTAKNSKHLPALKDIRQNTQKL